MFLKLSTNFGQKPSFSLDVFDVPVKKYLINEVRQLGHDPDEIDPVLDKAIERAKELLLQSREKLPLSPIRIRSRIENRAYEYVYGVLAQSKKWKDAKTRIRNWSSIFLVGAGLSFESDMPLSDTLEDLIKFCRAKDYNELRKDKDKCLKFKLEFKKICEKKSPGFSHKLIVKNFPKYILEIICLNWDNLIERAAEEMNKSIPKINEDKPVTGKRYLWKFHGDVENIKENNIKGEGGWVFPDEEGYVFNNFIQYIKEKGLKDTLFTFVIVGYSEKEKEIYNKIIRQFEEKPKRPTFRVGLDLKRLHENRYIVGPSDFILKKILPLKL